MITKEEFDRAVETIYLYNKQINDRKYNAKLIPMEDFYKYMVRVDGPILSSIKNAMFFRYSDMDWDTGKDIDKGAAYPYINDLTYNKFIKHKNIGWHKVRTLSWYLQDYDEKYGTNLFEELDFPIEYKR